MTEVLQLVVSIQNNIQKGVINPNIVVEPEVIIPPTIERLTKGMLVKRKNFYAKKGEVKGTVYVIDDIYPHTKGTKTRYKLKQLRNDKARVLTYAEDYEIYVLNNKYRGEEYEV